MRRHAIVLLDLAAVVAVLLAALIAATDGIVWRAGEWRVTLRSTDRAVLAAGVLIAIRLLVDRTSGVFGLSGDRWRRLLLPAGADPFVDRAAPGLLARALLASLGLAAALAVLMRAQLLNLHSVPDLEDPLFSVWRIAWVPHQLFNDPRHLFDANIFFPDQLTLTLSDSVILPSLMAAPLLAAGVHPVVTYNLLFLSGFWFSGIALYLLVERLTGSARAAFVSGLMFACYSFRLEHYSHLELQMTQWIPLALLALHLFVVTRRWVYALGLGLAVVAQLYSAMYYAVFLGIYGSVIGIGLLLTYRPPLRQIVPPLAVAALLAAVMAVPLVRAYSSGESAKWGRPLDIVQSFSAVPSDYLRMHPRSAVWSPLLPRGKGERELFPGAAPLVLGAIGLAPPMSAVRWTYAAGLLLSFDMSLGLNGWLYPFLHRHVDAMRVLRVTARFSVLVGMTLAIFAGFGVRRLLQRSRPSVAPVLFAALVALVMIDAWPRLELVPVWREPPTIYESLKKERRVVLFEMPVTRGNPDYFAENTPFMYFSVWHWLPMVNGYSGFIPQSYGELINEIEEFPKPEALDALRRRGVTHVTVNCVLYTVGCGDQLDNMERSAGLRQVVDTRWHGRFVRLYELVK